MATSLLLLLAVGFFFFSVEAQEAYNSLPETHRRGVDLALEKLHSHAGIQNHFLFFRSLTQTNTEASFEVNFVYHQFYLKATRCPKGTADPAGCGFRNDRPLIDCGLCYKTYRGEIEQEPKPYIHCIHKPALTEAMKTKRMEHCQQMAYGVGASTILASKGTE